MRTIYPGHRYVLENIDGEDEQIIQFVQRLPHHAPKQGTTSQEVIRVLIDRVIKLDAEQPWKGNEDIIKHLRLAMSLFEMRAFLKHVEQGKILPEDIETGDDGHFLFKNDPVDKS